MANNQELSKEAIAAINSYGDRIKTLKDFVTAVRKTPGYHIGATSSKAAKNMGREIFQNAVDQILEAASPCQGFNFFYDERTLEISVEDIGGLGIPFDQIIRVFNTPNTSKNYEKVPFQYSSGMHGSGAKVTNALSASFVVETFKYDGTAAKVEFVKGYPKTDSYVSIPNKEKKQGTRVTFIPDTDVLGEISLEWKEFYVLIKRILSQTPIGSYCNFTAIDIYGKTFTETIINKDGITTDLIMKIKRPIIKPITLGFDDGYHKLECAFGYDAGGEDGPDDRESVTAFCNFCETIGGTHIEGTIEGICRWFTLYMNNIYLVNQKSKNNKLKIIANDIKSGLNLTIFAAVLEPVFQSQSKDILANPEMAPFCKDVVLKGLDEWAKANPQDLAKISRFFKDIAEIRQKGEASKAKIATKYQANVITGLPAKYVRPLGKDNIELIIVEGDSALGTVKLGRDPKTQGLFPIRGKIINAFKTTKTNFFSNEEVQGITRIILGTDYKKGFDVKDCKVSKVIFMADADVDGAHISALLLRMFVMYFPQMIEAGMVYKAIPPLYAIKQGNKKRYFTENIDIVKYVQGIFLQNNTMTDLKKNKLENKDITKFFLRNTDYIYHLERISNTYAVQPYLLELVLIHYVYNKDKINLEKLRKEIKSMYRFMDAEKVGNNVIVKGTIDKSNLIIFNEKFISDCYHIINIMKENDTLHYLINGEIKSIYQIMKIYDNAMPSSVQRYKGLGEMDEDELAESTLYPGSDRTLVRYTLKDAKEEINLIREYESDSKKILTLVGNVTRDELLD